MKVRGVNKWGIQTRRGMLLMDSMVGLAVVLTLLMAMTVTVAHQNRAEEELAARRAQARRLEGTLLAMQAGDATDKNAAVERLGDTAPAGMVWVRVSFADGPRSSLVGLVPATGTGSQP